MFFAVITCASFSTPFLMALSSKAVRPKRSPEMLADVCDSHKPSAIIHRRNRLAADLKLMLLQ